MRAEARGTLPRWSRAPFGQATFLFPSPRPLPWGEGELLSVSGPHPRWSLPNQCAQNTRLSAVVPSPRGRGSGGGETTVQQSPRVAYPRDFSVCFSASLDQLCGRHLNPVG